MTDKDRLFPNGYPLDDKLARSLMESALTRLEDGTLGFEASKSLYHCITDLTMALAALQRSNDEDRSRCIADIVRQSYFIGALSAKPDQIDAFKKEQQSKRGVRSAQVRKDRAREGWHVHATELAIEIRKDHPSMRREPLAAEIVGRWRDQIHAAPTTRTITTMLKNLELTGVLVSSDEASA